MSVPLFISLDTPSNCPKNKYNKHNKTSFVIAKKACFLLYIHSTMAHQLSGTIFAYNYSEGSSTLKGYNG